MYSSVGGWIFSEKLKDYVDNSDLRAVVDECLILQEHLDGDPFFESDLVEFARAYYA